MLKLFGIIDLFAALALIGAIFGFTSNLELILVFLLLFKSVPFIPDIASIIDVITAGIFVLAIFGFTSFFTWIAVIWLAQKGLVSLASD
tara:strand:+ start:1743 stop:2009 length:267 start_codon:yes stop_codon:yes gene_type:complete